MYKWILIKLSNSVELINCQVTFNKWNFISDLLNMGGVGEGHVLANNPDKISFAPLQSTMLNTALHHVCLGDMKTTGGVI